MASSALMPRTSISCLKLSFFSYMLLCVAVLTKLALAGEAADGLGASVCSSLSVFTFVFIRPNITTAFLPLISKTCPTLLCPFIRT